MLYSGLGRGRKQKKIFRNDGDEMEGAGFDGDGTERTGGEMMEFEWMEGSTSFDCEGRGC
jgi:hypothetical protein